MVLYETKPTISLANGSPAGSGIPGLNEVFRFNVAADSRGNVTMHEFTFKFNTTDKAGSGWNWCHTSKLPSIELYDLNDLSTSLIHTLSQVNGYLADGTSCTALSADGVEEPMVYWQIGSPAASPVEIVAGSPETFALYVDTVNASSVNDDSLRVDLPSQAEMDAFGLYTIYWRGGVNDVGNGTYIESLPVYGGTITY